jgi:hypothetical protein
MSGHYLTSARLDELAAALAGRDLDVSRPVEKWATFAG